MRVRLGLKWKIFTMLAVLGLCTQAFDLWHSARLIVQATSNTEGGVKALLHHYLSFQQAISQGYAAAVDVWATSARLREVLQRGSGEEQRALLGTVQESIVTTLHPDVVVIVDRQGEAFVGPHSPIVPAEVRQMKVFTDLRVGQVIRNQFVEHRNVAYVVCGTPVEVSGQVVGAILLGIRVERLMREFKAQNEEAGQRNLELALVHNSKVTAATIDGELRQSLPEAVRQERRETIVEGGRKVSVIGLPEGRYEFQMASLSGYEDAVSTFVGGLYVLRNRSDKEQRIQALVLSSYQVVMVTVLIALLAAALLTWLVMRPIRAFIAATAEIARGQGDLTRRLPVGTTDELGRLAQNLNELFENLYRLAQNVSGASQQVGTSSAEISSLSKQMLAGARDQAAKIGSSGNAVTELSTSIQQVAENATQATKVARESGAQVQVAIDCMDRIRQTVEEAGERIGDLGESGKRIGNIVEVIRQISEQTSLLALNASIEAAHAGEQGRGFAVVADEVSSLARRVGQSAEDIEELIGTIRDQTDEAVRSMQNGTREVEGGTQVVTQTLGALRKIVEVVQETAKAVQEQAVISDDIARNMDAVRAITREVVTSLEEAVVQGEALHVLAMKLEESVSGFNVAEGAAALPPSPVTAALAAAGSRPRRQQPRD